MKIIRSKGDPKLAVNLTEVILKSQELGRNNEIYFLFFGETNTKPTGGSGDIFMCLMDGFST
jgi:hypothetical protein